MAGICDICGGKTGFMNSFRCQDGVICKNCYRIVSNNYSDTITRSTLLDLKKRYIRNAQPLDMGDEGFQTTKKLGSFLLLDEKNQKLCLLSNQSLTKSYSRPEIYRYDDLESFELVSAPKHTDEELEELSKEKHSQVVIHKMAVRLHLKTDGTREIIVIPTPVRTSTLAFRQAYRNAAEIMSVLRQIKL